MPSRYLVICFIIFLFYFFLNLADWPLWLCQCAFTVCTVCHISLVEHCWSNYRFFSSDMLEHVSAKEESTCLYRGALSKHVHLYMFLCQIHRFICTDELQTPSNLHSVVKTEVLSVGCKLEKKGNCH